MPTTVISERDIDTLISAFKSQVQDLKLWQYYVLDPVREKDSVQTSLQSGKVSAWTGQEVKGKTVVELAQIVKQQNKLNGLGQFASRFGVHVDGAFAAGLVRAAFVEIQGNDALADAWVRVVDVLNVPFYEEWDGDFAAAIGNVRNRVTYTRLDTHGPKLGEISKKYVG